jgi:hypothetical protein
MKTDNGRPIISGFKIIRHQQGDSATLQWYMDFELRWYPWEKFRSLFYENIYGLQMEQGLLNLKELSEERRRRQVTNLNFIVLCIFNHKLLI